jgi:hypothetical protein
MAIGTAIFTIFLILLFVHNPGFRKFALSAFALVVIIAIVLVINASIPEQTRPIYFGERPHAAFVPKASSKPKTDPDDARNAASAPSEPTSTPTPTHAPQASKPITNSDLLINSILHGPSNYVPSKDKFVAGDENHCPSDHAWDWQNKSCRLGTSFRAVGPD